MLLKHDGFSLTEMMVTMLIFALLSGGVLMSMTAGEASWQTNRSQTVMQQELRRASEWMKNELRQTGHSAIVDVPADGNRYTSIAFKLPTGVSGGSTTWSSNDVVYALSGTTLQRTEGTSVRTIARDVSAVEFGRLAASPNVLNVQINMQRQAEKGEVLTEQLIFNVYLRNR